jgi:HSP20 family protein
MFNIPRFNPIDDAFDSLIRGVPVWLPNLERREAAPAQFRMDVSENEREYQVAAEMPGLKKEEISITINGNEVSVSAEVKQEKDAKNGDTVLRSERYFGKIQRAFTLPHEVDQANAQAKYADGVLQLTLPKKTAAALKKLAVH